MAESIFLKPFHSRALFILLSSLLFTAGCAMPAARIKKADNIAAAAGFHAEIFDLGHFKLAIWQKRQNKSDATATIYIEGDGMAWISRRRPSMDPTPTNPVALRLAANDRNENIIYAARPCQYIKTPECQVGDWTDARFSPDIIETYHRLLDSLKTYKGYRNFHLVGYSGGAAIAAITAAGRNDILSLRTVAGNLDNDAFTKMHSVSAMPRSLNAINYAPSLRYLPQIHYISPDDVIIGGALAENWRTNAGSPCVRVISVSGPGHEDGWAAKWHKLSAMRASC